METHAIDHMFVAGADGTLFESRRTSDGNKAVGDVYANNKQVCRQCYPKFGSSMGRQFVGVRVDYFSPSNCSNTVDDLGVRRRLSTGSSSSPIDQKLPHVP